MPNRESTNMLVLASNHILNPEYRNLKHVDIEELAAAAKGQNDLPRAMLG